MKRLIDVLDITRIGHEWVYNKCLFANENCICAFNESVLTKSVALGLSKESLRSDG